MLWCRSQPAPEPPIDHDEVMEIFWALADIKAIALDILGILRREEDDEETEGY